MNKNFWRERRVFITGCTGLLGSWLTADLLALGADITGLIRDRIPQSELFRSGNIECIKAVHGDICDYDLLERTMAEYEIEIVFHLASQSVVGIANRAPMSTFEANI
ncbi:MAG TPA: NAD-dependent epimerase/dehydratase family protein, partial [Anaerolineae bacterium]|nr:NAD-dependent epimerase/dehydratase family protein [Anaerolineae bacterium]